MTPPASLHLSDPALVCKLTKSLYGLRQASRQWNFKLTVTLTIKGFIQSKSDYALFTRGSLTGFTIVLTYVDDLILVGNNLSEITQLKSLLHNKFGIKNLGPLRFFLGFEITRYSKGISLNQRKYALDLLQDTGLLAFKPLSTPMDYSLTLSMVVGSSIPDASIYRRLLGRLVYLTNSRPDISFVVSKLSQFLSQSSSIHLQVVLRVLWYIKGNPTQGLFFPTQSSLHLTSFFDSNWGACPDTRRSVTGFCFFLGFALVSWKSKKQTTISRSSFEVEYRALAQASCEAQWPIYLLQDFGISLT